MYIVVNSRFQSCLGLGTVRVPDTGRSADPQPTCSKRAAITEAAIAYRSRSLAFIGCRWFAGTAPLAPTGVDAGGPALQVLLVDPVTAHANVGAGGPALQGCWPTPP